MAKIRLTKAEIDAMPPDDLTRLLLTASKIEATAVVRRRDGSVKYDDPSKAGQYGEQFLKGEE
jgi:hypothetical protein